MNENMRHWNKVCRPDPKVMKPIQAGRLKGKSDINPQWRMQAMTETFGPVGFGWNYTVEKLWMEPGSGNQMAAFALVNVTYKDNGEWSCPIPGIGGSMFIENEKNGPYTSDEAYKMAVTDALSVAFKALGLAAEVYLGNFDGSKYKTSPPPQDNGKKPELSQVQKDIINALGDIFHGNMDEMADALRTYSEKEQGGKTYHLTWEQLATPTTKENMQSWFTYTLHKMQSDRDQ